MAKLFVFRTGQTIWEIEDRLDSAAGAPLTGQGVKAVQDCAGQLAGQEISGIYAGTGEAERQSAELIAGQLGCKVRTVNDLRELDYGLWQGLTAEEIKRRQPKLYRQWLESPASVRPPGGETLSESLGRLRRALGEILRRDGAPSLIVLRPVMLGLLRCVVRNQPIEDMRQNVDPEFTWACYEMNGNQL